MNTKRFPTGARGLLGTYSIRLGLSRAGGLAIWVFEFADVVAYYTLEYHPFLPYDSLALLRHQQSRHQLFRPAARFQNRLGDVNQ